MYRVQNVFLRCPTPKKNWVEGIKKAMNDRNLNEGQWEDRKLDFTTRTIFGKEYRSLSSSLYNFLHSPVNFVPLRPKYSPQHPIGYRHTRRICNTYCFSTFQWLRLYVLCVVWFKADSSQETLCNELCEARASVTAGPITNGPSRDRGMWPTDSYANCCWFSHSIFSLWLLCPLRLHRCFGYVILQPCVIWYLRNVRYFLNTRIFSPPLQYAPSFYIHHNRAVLFR